MRFTKLTFSRIESCNLHDVIAFGPLERVHLFLDTQTTELAHVVLRIPSVQILVKTVEPEYKLKTKWKEMAINVPVSRSTQVAYRYLVMLYVY